jgi:capsular exopolysaccharide synthesis family protein
LTNAAIEQPTQPLATQGIREYLRILRRRRWLVLGTFLGVVFTTWVVSTRMTPIFEATTQLELQTTPSGNPQQQFEGGGVDERDLQTQATLMKSHAVLSRAAKELRLTSVNDLKNAVDVELVRDTQIVEIRVEHRLPEEAEAWANAITSAYQAYRQERIIERIVALSESIGKQIQEAETKIAALDQSVASGARDLAVVKNERDSLVTSRQALEAQRQNLPGVEAIRSGSGLVIAPAEASDSPVRPKTITNLAFGGVIGLLLAVGLALLTETLADRITSPEEIEERLSTTVLGHVPSVKEAKGGDRASLVLLDDPVSGAAEAYRTLRTNLRFLSLERPLNAILLTSAVPGEGKTTTATNLAVAFAQAGTRTILLSADLRRPSAHKFFGLPDTVGLVGALNPEVPIDETLQATGIKNFRIMSAGGLPPNPTEILGSARFSVLMNSLIEASDTLIIDAPPALGLADASALASKVDGVVFVVDTHLVTRRELSHAADQIRKAGGRIIGAVVNSVEPEEGYGYYYPHYYQDLEDEEEEQPGPTGQQQLPRLKGWEATGS